MLIEQSAYANRWRRVAPAAKGVFALAGFVAAFAAATPRAALAVAALICLVTLAGARVTIGRYLRVAAPALIFLAISCLSLAFSVNVDVSASAFDLTPGGLQSVAAVGARSLGALASLLFLVLTTPLIDLIALLRRLRTPEILLEIMVLCYRMLFVFFGSGARHADRASGAPWAMRPNALALRSLGGLAANLTLQVWQRASDLHIAAQARNNDGPLRFIEPTFANGRRDVQIAAAGGGALIALALLLGRGI